ncbi:hypothetical protein DV737_g834, partial [Chaetothyriales sp. CBS 132003]
MLATLLILVPLVVVEATEGSPARRVSAPSIVQHGAINASPASNSPRNLQFLPGPAGFVPISSLMAPTTVSIQGVGKAIAEEAAEEAAAATWKAGSDQKRLPDPLATAPCKMLHSMSERVKREEERVLSDEPLLGVAITPSTTAMTVTLSCQLHHTFYRCDMAMNGLTSEVCLTAEGQVLWHVPFATRTPSLAPDAGDTTKTAPLPTVATPATTVAAAAPPIATDGQTHTGTLPEKASVTCDTVGTNMAIVTTMPTTLPSGNVVLVTTIPTMLDSALLTPPDPLSTGAALHNHDTTKPLGNQKVNAASPNGRAILRQALVCVALGVVLLISV